MKKKTQEEFISEVKQKHGDKYGLENCVYSGYLEMVTVNCPIHGDFSIRADHFLRGCGCHKCAKESANKKQMLTNDEFIDRARKVHQGKYSYAKTEYDGLSNDVIITCPKHGDFEQNAGNHLNGRGCPMCGKEKSIKRHSLTFGDFKKRADVVHNGKYDYIEETFKNGKSKMTIICPKHGEFSQRASVHLLGQGCPICGREKSTKVVSESKSTTEFINEARKLHNEKYDYSKVEYENNYTDVIILCPKHGEFLQTPKNHLKGSGCPRCKTSRLESDVAKVLNEIGIQYIHRASKRDLDWIGNQHLDFYIPSKMIAIECQGEQHFSPIDFAGKGDSWALKKLNEQQRLDTKKIEKCHKNGVQLFYINFDDNIVKSVKAIIDKFQT